MNRNVLITRMLILCMLILLTYHQAQAYNSEEHKVLTDKGVEGVVIPDDVMSKLSDAGVTFGDVTKSAYIKVIKSAKMLAVGFDTNNPADYDKWKLGVQDNCYWDNFRQLDYNKKIWIPDAKDVPEKQLSVKTHLSSKASSFTLGELVALYGDYRRTTYCDDDSGACYLTSGDTEKINFTRGSLGWRGYCPGRIESDVYLRAIASGVVPPIGKWGNEVSNTANRREYSEVGWWGDDLLRIANVNDWHFTNAAVAWYTGLHRLALIYLEKAIKDPKYWVQALHYEANALHTLTDLFAFGHVVTNRGESAHGMLSGKAYYNPFNRWNIGLNASSSLEMTASKWMENVIRVGGGTRDGNGRVTLNTKTTDPNKPTLPSIEDATPIRDDMMMSDRGTWVRWSYNELSYHDTFNHAGAEVYNLKGTKFQIYGDGILRDTPDDTKRVIWDAVKASAQSLFDAYVALENGSKTVDNLGEAGSDYFEALKYIPVFVESDGSRFFTGMWALYAKAVDDFTGAGIVPDNWKACETPYLYGKDFFNPSKRDKCTDFPTVDKN